MSYVYNIVSGAASGIGKAVSSLLLSRGAQVVAVDASQKLLDQLPDKGEISIMINKSHKETTTIKSRKFIVASWLTLKMCIHFHEPQTSKISAAVG